jgi:hypothetical protein
MAEEKRPFDPWTGIRTHCLHARASCGLLNNIVECQLAAVVLGSYLYFQDTTNPGITNIGQGFSELCEY